MVKDKGANPQQSHPAVLSSGEPAVQGTDTDLHLRCGYEENQDWGMTTQRSGLFKKGLFELCVNISLKNT